MSPVFRVLPRASSEAPNPAPVPSRPPPHLYNNISTSSLPHSPHPHHSCRVGFCTAYSEHPSRSLLLVLTHLSLEKPITVPSVLFRRAQISSQVCINALSSSHPHPPFSLPYSQLYPFVQLGPSLSLPLLSLLRHSLLQIFVRN
jgi:hypothetical protein